MAELILADWLTTIAATMVGDPDRGRIKTADWLQFYNLSMNDICSLYDIVQFEQVAALPADALCSYPAESTRISRVEANATPADATTWVTVGEIFEDEWRRHTVSGVPTSDIPRVYFADQGYLRLGAKITADIANGLKITHYGVPDNATDLTVTYMPLPNFMKSYAAERMAIYGLRSDNRDAQANEWEDRWNQREGFIRMKLEDKSTDRRDAIRPAAARNRFGGMA